MWNKNNTTWNKEDNYLSTDLFERFLEKLKTYSKCINASTYSVTNTLEDIYSIIKYQHAFWVEITNLGPEEVVLDNITLKKGELYNLTDSLSSDEINNDTLLKLYLQKDVAILKATNSLLFNEEGTINYDFFLTYEPVEVEITGSYSTSGFIGGTSGTASTSFVVSIIQVKQRLFGWMVQMVYMIQTLNTY